MLGLIRWEVFNIPYLTCRNVHLELSQSMHKQVFAKRKCIMTKNFMADVASIGTRVHDIFQIDKYQKVKNNGFCIVVQDGSHWPREVDVMSKAGEHIWSSKQLLVHHVRCWGRESMKPQRRLNWERCVTHRRWWHELTRPWSTRPKCSVTSADHLSWSSA